MLKSTFVRLCVLVPILAILARVLMKQRPTYDPHDMHAFIAPKDSDSRSPCPALNALANHGYITRDGRNITPMDLVYGMQAAYQLSTPLAYFLSFTGFLILGQYTDVSLADIARHDKIEHDASIAHDDAAGREYAPTAVNRTLFDAFVRDSASGTRIAALDIATTRVRRERESRGAIDAVHQEIARGEAALVLQIFGDDEQRVPVEVIESWWRDERMPEGWKPMRTTTLRGTVGQSKAIRQAMKTLRAAADARPDNHPSDQVDAAHEAKPTNPPIGFQTQH